MEDQRKKGNKVKKNAVQLLTIHASKGLEFPYVIIPECGKRFNYAIQKPVLINTDKTIHLNIFKYYKNPYKESVTEKIKNQVTNEEKRIFYVACTRAEKELFLLGTHHFKAIKDKNSYTDFLFSIGEFSEKENTNNPKLRTLLTLQVHIILKKHLFLWTKNKWSYST